MRSFKLTAKMSIQLLNQKNITKILNSRKASCTRESSRDIIDNSKTDQILFKLFYKMLIPKKRVMNRKITLLEI